MPHRSILMYFLVFLFIDGSIFSVAAEALPEFVEHFVRLLYLIGVAY